MLYTRFTALTARFIARGYTTDLPMLVCLMEHETTHHQLKKL